MPSIYAEIEINAARSIVWRSLVQKQDWLKWNTFLYDRAPDQPFARGQSIPLSLKRLSDEAETEFQALITLIQPDVCLKWVAAAPGFQAEHVFELQEIGLNRTKYTHRENVSGALSRIFLPFIRQDEQQGLRRMANELKRYAERAHRYQGS
jgi:hypothetical protein